MTGDLAGGLTGFEPYASLFVAVLGLIVGSFLNVCIFRLPAGLSIVSPSSRCGACGHALSWFENIPLVSYAVLRGRCRACGARISLQYPIVELATAVLFLGLYRLYGPTPIFAVRALFASAMIVLFMIDLEHQILPNEITLPGIVVGFVLSTVYGPGWFDSLVGILAGGGVLYLIAEAYYRIRHEDGLGMGDVKMLAMIGAFLGWRLVLVTLVLSSLLGSVVGIAIVLARRESLKYALPYGTFLAVAAIIAAIAGHDLIAWYLAFYPSQ